MASNWNDTDGGQWRDATSWSPAIVPNGTGADAVIQASGSYTVRIDGGETFTVRDLTLGSDDATLDDGGMLIVKRTATVSDGTYHKMGTLDLRAAGATLSVTGGTVNLDNATVVGGTLVQSGSGVLQVSRSCALDGTGAGGATLAAGSTLRMTDNSFLALSGTFANAGTVSLASTGANVRLTVDHDVTLTGGGTILLGQTPANINAIRSNVSGITSTLTNVDNTIKGAGALYGDSTPPFGTLAIVNQAAGIIDATSATQALTIDSMVLTNDGLVEATAAGGLILSATSGVCTLDQTGGGTLKAVGTGSHVDVVNSATVKGGTIAASGGGEVRIGAGGANTFDGTGAGGLTLASGTAVKIQDGTALHITGAIANSGTISLNGTGNNTRLLVDGAATLTGGGSVVLNNGPNALFSFVNGSSLDNVDNTIRGSGDIDLGRLALTNQAGGTINAASASTALTIESGTLTNKGLVEATGAGGLTLYGLMLGQSGAGTLKAVGSGRHVDLVGSTVAGGTITTSGGGEIRTGAFTNVFDGTVAGGLTITAGSTVRVLNANNLHLTGAIRNAGTIAMEATGNNTSLILDAATTLTGGGDIVLGDGATNQIYASAAGSRLDNVDNTLSGAGLIAIGNLSLTNEAGGTIDANGSGPLTIDGGFTNKGLIEATGGGVLQINGALDNVGIIRGVVSQSGGQTTVTADAPGQLHLTGGSGDNRITVTTAPTHVDGGAGTDTLVIAGSMSLAAGSLASIEKIEVGNGLSVSLANLSTGLPILIASTVGGGSTVTGTKGADSFTSGAGADMMKGGLGNDGYVVNGVGDTVVEAAGYGTDTVQSSVTYTLAANVERLTLTGTGAISGTGNASDNLLTGNGAANGLTGADGADTLVGAGGHDTLSGGAQADSFQFRALSDSTAASTGRDTIKDFSQGDSDRIDLHLIDAKSASTANDAFTFIGPAAFGHHAGELRAQVYSSYTIVSGDVNGDAVADFSIQTNKLTFTGGDFLL